jgi:eukaryotic-like serine/threonine-protein kinase
VVEGGSELAAGVRRGDVVGGKYRIDDVLGIGGMGIVVAAYHLKLETKVAIKFLLPAMLADEEAVARFAREARAAAKISDEYVARVLDVGALETGAPYMVMEFLDGVDLESMLRAQGPLPCEQAVEFVLQACVAVADAHGLGIVHRDLKPQNLFCVRRTDGQLSIKVLDFGISKVSTVSPMEMSVTRTSSLLGSPLYMSPEQMQFPKEVDPRSDVWGLGVILYQLLAGRVPFIGETATEICMKIATQAPPALRGFRPDAPDGIEAVILRCLEKDRVQRYRDVAELAAALLEFAPKRAHAVVERIAGIVQAAGKSGVAQPVSPFFGPPGDRAVIQSTAPLGRTTPPEVKGRRSPVFGMGTIGLAAVLCAVVVTGVVLVTKRPSAGALQPDRDRSTVAPAAAAGPLRGLPYESIAPPSQPPPETAPPALTPSTPVATAPATAAVAPAGAGPGAKGLKPRPPASGASSAKTNCDPNYYFDAQGQKHFKHECFLEPHR